MVDDSRFYYIELEHAGMCYPYRVVVQPSWQDTCADQSQAISAVRHIAGRDYSIPPHAFSLRTIEPCEPRREACVKELRVF